MPDPISWSFSGPYLLAALAFGYLCGSVPFGLIITRMAGLGDIRKIGSGNIGTTNVLRTGSKKLAALTLLLDLLKGTLPVLIAKFYGPDPALAAGFGAFIGHLFPVWLRFKGGKGVATYIGVILGLIWPVALLFVVIWIAMAFAFRYSSLSALSAMALVPFSIFFRFPEFLYPLAEAIPHVQVAQLAGTMSVISWFMHRDNISRLLSGKESKIGSKK